MKLSYDAANFAADSVCALLDGGKLCLYASNKILLAELTFSTPAFEPASGGKATARPIGEESSAKATGTATYFLAKANGRTIFEGDIGTEDADLIMDDTSIAVDAIVNAASLVYVQGRSV